MKKHMWKYGLAASLTLTLAAACGDDGDDGDYITQQPPAVNGSTNAGTNGVNGAANTTNGTANGSGTTATTGQGAGGTTAGTTGTTAGTGGTTAGTTTGGDTAGTTTGGTTGGDTAGATAGSTGGGAEGPLCSAAPADACEECGCTQCATQMNACNTLEGNAVEGPAAGTPKSQLCQALVVCGQTTGCRGDACYCGEGVDIVSCLTFGPSGPCIDEVTAAAESEDALTISSRKESRDQALMFANQVSSCTVESCASECQ